MVKMQSHCPSKRQVEWFHSRRKKYLRWCVCSGLIHVWTGAARGGRQVFLEQVSPGRQAQLPGCPCRWPQALQSGPVAPCESSGD